MADILGTFLALCFGVLLVATIIDDFWDVHVFWGDFALVVSIIVLPLTILIAPVVWGFTYGYWAPALSTYLVLVPLFAWFRYYTGRGRKHQRAGS